MNSGVKVKAMHPGSLNPAGSNSPGVVRKGAVNHANILAVFVDAMRFLEWRPICGNIAEHTWLEISG